jgi:hypothetical protein
MGFHEDLAFGQKYEQIAISLLDGAGRGDICLPPPGKHSPWDFKHNNNAYEVKADRRANSTGNLCIEYEHTGIPSGISITEAEHWIYFVIVPTGYMVYKIPVSVLRSYLTKEGVRRCDTDGGNSRFLLVPLREFTPFKFHNNI